MKRPPPDSTITLPPGYTVDIDKIKARAKGRPAEARWLEVFEMVEEIQLLRRTIPDFTAQRWALVSATLIVVGTSFAIGYILGFFRLI